MTGRLAFPGGSLPGTRAGVPFGGASTRPTERQTMLPSSSEPARTGVAVIYYCPNDQPIEQAAAIARYRYLPQTSFLELLREASVYFGEDFENVVLKDNFGTHWPVQREVWRELAALDRHIRLCRIDMSEVEEEVVEEEIVEEEEEEEDDPTKPRTPRPPLYKELLVHLIYLAQLLTSTYLASAEQVCARMRQSPSRLP